MQKGRKHGGITLTNDGIKSISFSIQFDSLKRAGMRSASASQRYIETVVSAPFCPDIISIVMDWKEGKE